MATCRYTQSPDTSHWHVKKNPKASATSCITPRSKKCIWLNYILLRLTDGNRGSNRCGIIVDLLYNTSNTRIQSVKTFAAISKPCLSAPGCPHLCQTLGWDDVEGMAQHWVSGVIRRYLLAFSVFSWSGCVSVFVVHCFLNCFLMPARSSA